MWYDKINRIVCLNLAHREDRLLFFVEQAEKYGLPFERVEAIYDEQQGARGLRDTLIKLFTEEIDKETDHLLVFEDDCDIVVDKELFIDTMEKVVEQLPSDYHMILLGCQLCGRIQHFHSPNIFQVVAAFSTHAVLYSLRGMRTIVSSNLGFPIDNDMVERIQPLGKTYSVYPLLCSQVEGFSDIGRNKISWKPFIEGRYEQKINEYKLGMR